MRNRKYKDLVPDHLRFLVAVHVLLLAIYSSFRYVTLAYNRPSYFFQADRSLSLWKAFKIGFEFDVTVASYALLVPYFLLTVAFISPRPYRRLYKTVRVWCGAVVLASLIICAADVPYFNFFNSRLTVSAVNFKNSLQVLKYLSSEVKYYPFILLGLVCIWSTSKVMRLLWHRNWTSSGSDHSPRTKWLSTGLASLLMLGGLWGGATPQAPNMRKAIFSNDGFINQLTLNPVHTWFDSYFDFDVALFSNNEAIRKVRSLLGVGQSTYDSPIAKDRHFSAPAAQPLNVVVVLMESMSAYRMGVYGKNPHQLTPGLDSIARNSVFFSQCFSNGIHTNAGIYSTLYGMPIRMMEHPMNNGRSEFLHFTGLPVTLRELGYQTKFFCTHPKTFDNLDVFLERNGFEDVSDLSDYPTSKIANSWGVGDETLYEHALYTLDSMASDASGKPFFATVLSITTHPPFTLPAFTKFKPHSTDPIDITYEYADWAIKNFMDSCATKDWYRNTVFVLVGDHGVNLPSNYDVPLSYNHVPLIIHAPGIFKKPEQRNQLANQTDIFPTIMGLLRLDYTQNTFGYDLFRERRPFAYFSQDHKLGITDGRFLYVARKSGTETLYDCHANTADDLDQLYPALVDSMKNYTCAQLQVANLMIDKKWTGTPK